MSTAHILIIEDDDLVSRTVERSLSSNEFQISLADNGLDGIKTARKLSPDLVILDVIMPEIDGYEVCRRMRADAQLSEIPILSWRERMIISPSHSTSMSLPCA
jgi:DNA-binding response OmpR family regulator